MKSEKLYKVLSTLTTHREFQVAEKDIVKAVSKATRIVKKIEPEAEIIKVELLSVLLVEEDGVA